MKMSIGGYKDYDGLVASKGGMFDVSNHEMEANIGRRVKFHVLPSQGTKHREVHTIVGIQKIWNGDIAYRVQTDEKDFGIPAKAKEIYFID